MFRLETQEANIVFLQKHLLATLVISIIQHIVFFFKQVATGVCDILIQ
jgi:hypothetical protein